MQLNLSTRHLRAFLALAELRSFTRAAHRCHLSQPAFSALARSRKDAVGARLFDRDTRNVELTAEGRTLEEQARRLLADFETLAADIPIVRIDVRSALAAKSRTSKARRSFSSAGPARAMTQP